MTSAKKQRTSSELPADALSVVFGFFGFHDLFGAGQVSREWRTAAKCSNLSTWPRLSPRQFIATVACLGPDQVQQLDLDLDHCLETRTSGRLVNKQRWALWEGVEAGLRRCLALKQLEVCHGPVCIVKARIWRAIDLSALKSLTTLTLTNVLLGVYSLKDIPTLRVLRLISCKTSDWSLPRTLRELHVIQDQELSFDGLVNACASVEHLSVVSDVYDHLKLDHDALLTLCRRSQRLQSLTVKSWWLWRASDELLELARDCKSACPSLQRVSLCTHSEGQILNQVEI
jgi:hypothetical protein